MGEVRTIRRCLPIALGVVLFAGLVAAFRPEPEPILHMSRPRSLRNRVECVLEKWGVIPFNPFRHVND
ncbi:hypothetical protein FRUB_07639 [Fimbriiglobus ruber]|uniref:Uncharacterized protein n=1 Tax=Fimbriiglobus ruber TaxID=1908690 RepID=A0A225DMR0_9BACT|nr:hypothetical protein FRUB_07639 [Fimbriiglobus ruber]